MQGLSVTNESAPNDEVKAKDEKRVVLLPVRPEATVETFTGKLIEALDRITDGFFVVARDWTVLYVNRQAERVAGYSRENVIGKNLWEIAPQSVGTIYDLKYHEAMETGRPVSFIEYYPPFELYFETHVYPSEAGLSIYFRDVTDRIKDEQKRNNDINQLEQTTKDLEATNRELEQFAAIASHDLKEPLRMLMLYVDLLNRQYGGKLGSTGEGFLNHLSGAARRLYSLIDGLTVCSRLNSLQLDFQNSSSETLLKAALENLKEVIAESNAEISYQGLPQLDCLPSELTRVFQNLISNAAKFQKDGEIPKIKILCRDEGDQWVFSVEDNGLGFAEEDTPLIFEMFKRLPYHSQLSGSGLGLAICKKIVERHGGRIWARSQRDSGSCFYFAIPKKIPC